MKRTGKIRTITEKTGETAKGMWKNYVFEMTDGFKCGTFDKKIGEEFNAGDDVEFECEQKGDFFNIKTMTTEPAQPEVKGGYTQRDREIIAQCLTKCVAEGKMNKEQALETFKFFMREL